MRRMIWSVLTCGAVLASGGCRICQNPFDYTGPVVGAACPHCGGTHRSGSILSGSPTSAGAEVTYDDQIVEGEVAGEEVVQPPVR